MTMASPNTTPRIVELAAKISASVAELQALLSAQKWPSPSFDEDSPERLPPNAFHLQDAVLDATAELHELLMDPIRMVFQFGAMTNMVSIDALCRYGIADKVPPGGRISFSGIAQKTGLDEASVRRLLRHAMAMHILKEPEPGMVAHTKISRYFMRQYVKDWFGFGAQEGWPAAAKMLDAIEKWPGSEQSNTSGFSLANNGKSIFEVLGTDEARAKRVASGLKAQDHFPGLAATDVPHLYDWSSVGKGLVVQVGGQRGVAIELARRFGEVKLLIQDRADVKNAKARLPAELKDRIDFQPHALLDKQDVEADVYLFHIIFQTVPGKSSLPILRAQIPALRPGVKIVIMEIVAPEPGKIPLWRERELRAMDLNVGASFGGRIRSLHEWKALLSEADKRFVLQRAISPRGSLLSTLEIIWDPSNSKKA